MSIRLQASMGITERKVERMAHVLLNKCFSTTPRSMRIMVLLTQGFRASDVNILLAAAEREAGFPPTSLVAIQGDKS